MEARVIATGERVDVKYVFGYFDHNYETQDGKKYHSIELDFSGEPDYWTRLEHQYAGMAMQGILGNQTYTKSLLETSTSAKDARDIIVGASYYLAHALVEKLKEKEE